MNRWLRKKYRLFSGLFLAVLFVGWTAFINNSDSRPSEASSRLDDVHMQIVSDDGDNVAGEQSDKASEGSSDSVTPDVTSEPVVEITPEPTLEATPEPTVEATPEPTAEATPEPTAEATPEPTAEATPEPTAEATPEPTAEVTPEPTPEEVARLEITFPYAIANISTRMNVRSGPGEDSAVIGKMSSNAYCEVLEWGPEWTKIKSGTITGYAYTEYLLFNDECIEKLQRLNKLLIKVTSNTLNIRSMPNTDSKVLDKAYNGHKYMYIPQQSVEGWYCIQYSETQVGYMSAEFCTIYIDSDTAVPVS